MRDRCPIGGRRTSLRHTVGMCALGSGFCSCFVAAARPSDTAILVAEFALPGHTERNQTLEART